MNRIKHNQIKNLFVVLALTSLFATDAMARGNPFVTSTNIQRLLEATRNVTKADALKHRPFLAQTRLRVAGYRAKLVLAVLKRQRGSVTAKHALQVTVEKLSDPFLSVSEKVEIGIDCLGVAIADLSQKLARQGHAKKAAKKALRFVKLITPCNFYGPMTTVLSSVEGILHQASGRGVGQAIDAVQIAIDKASDPYLTDSEKQYFVIDCVNVAISALR